jgi:hypothetical protein
VTSYALIKSLIKSLPDQPLLIPLQPHTSQSIFHTRHLKPWTRGEFVESITRTCTKFGFWIPPINGAEVQGGCSILSHSNGSVPHAWSMLTLSGRKSADGSFERYPKLGITKYLRRPYSLLYLGRGYDSLSLLSKTDHCTSTLSLNMLMTGNGTPHVIFDSKRNWNCPLHPSCKFHRSMKLMNSISTGRRIPCFSMRSQQVGIIRKQPSS